MSTKVVAVAARRAAATTTRSRSLSALEGWSLQRKGQRTQTLSLTLCNKGRLFATFARLESKAHLVVAHAANCSDVATDLGAGLKRLPDQEPKEYEISEILWCYYRSWWDMQARGLQASGMKRVHDLKHGGVFRHATDS